MRSRTVAEIMVGEPRKAEEAPNRHILVVDDDDDVRSIIALMLAARGYRVSVAASAKVMRDILCDGDPVDAVVLDVVLRGERGFGLQLEATISGVPVVMISGNPEAMRLAADLHLPILPKPFRADELYKSLDKAIASGRREQRES